MAVTGHYLADRVRVFLLPTMEAYGPSLLNDILPAFSNLERRAEEVAREEFKRLMSLPADDDDGSGAAEAAQGKGEIFYEAMLGLRQAIVNLLSAGLFHLVEQQLASLGNDASFPTQPPDTKLAEVVEWYKRYLRVDLKQLRSWTGIDELRLLANTVKHAEGDSAERLRQRRPELFEDPYAKKHWPDLARMASMERLWLPLAGEGLYVTEEQFADYATAAVVFFRALADYFDEHGDDEYPHP